MEENIKVEDVSGIEKKISIWVNPDKVNEKFDDFYKNIKKEAQLPGFRKGKVPANILRQRFHNKAKGLVAQTLSSEYYQTAVKEHNLNAVGKPTPLGFEPNDLCIGKFNEDKSYSVELKIEVLPKIDPVGLDDIKLDYPECYDLDRLNRIVGERVEVFQKRFAERRQITDAGCELGDSLVINFSGSIDGVKFDGGSAENFIIDALDEGSLIPGFEKQLVGLVAGESRVINVKFPDDYHATHLAGKDSEFDVKLLSVVRKTPAKVDNDLALMAGFESVEKMLEDTKKNVELELKAGDVSLFENTILEHLVKANDFLVPNALVVSEKERLLKTLKQQQMNDALLKQVDVVSLKNVKRALILDAVYDKLGLELTPDELDIELDKHAKSNNKSKDELVSLLYNSNQMDSFVSVIKNKKTVEHLIELNTKKVG